MKIESHTSTQPASAAGRVAVSLLLAVLLAGCNQAMVKNPDGKAVVDVNPGERGPVAGVGVESHDIVSMTDKMVRDLLSIPSIVSRTTPPRIIMDDSDFINEGSQPINKNLIINRMRINLARSAQGRLTFVGREYSATVEQERALKREGVVDQGTTGLTRAQFGADYKLVGSIATLESYQPSSGLVQRYTQITFELIDLETSALIWGNQYEISRAAADDVIYR
jgi:PBP1b-binding outer membrane lipoprotein LpoB